MTPVYPTRPPPEREATPVDRTFDQLVSQVENLQKALTNRDVIGQAKGVLMERFKITADEAFQLLVQRSQHENVKVADLAERVATTGEWTSPVPPAGRSR